MRKTFKATSDHIESAEGTRPRLVTYALIAAWSHWALVALLTVSTISRPVLLGLALPTLATQALLILATGWGSNVARASFFVWTIFTAILGATAGTAGSTEAGFAELIGLLGECLMVASLLGLLTPASNRWYLAQRATNKAASLTDKVSRAKRNLKVALAWLLVFPVSAVIALPLKTPLLAVFISCSMAMCVGATIAIRQARKLHRLRANSAHA